jgi:hypothetical protein
VQTYGLVDIVTEDNEPDVDGEDNGDAEPAPTGYIRARRAIPVTVHQPIDEHGTRQFQGRLLGAMCARGVIHHYRVEGDNGHLYLTPPGWIAGSGKHAGAGYGGSGGMTAQIIALQPRSRSPERPKVQAPIASAHPASNPAARSKTDRQRFLEKAERLHWWAREIGLTITVHPQGGAV